MLVASRTRRIGRQQGVGKNNSVFSVKQWEVQAKQQERFPRLELNGMQWTLGTTRNGTDLGTMLTP